VKSHQPKLQSWTNLTLGEVWVDLEQKEIESHFLMNRAENYTGIPDEVQVLTLGVDVQKDRLEAQLVGWGVDEEAWIIEHRIIYGDTLYDPVWKELDAMTLDVYPKSDGTKLRISATAIDAGYRPDQVHRFCKRRLARRVYACIGRDGIGRPVWGRPNRNNKMRVPVFVVGDETSKTIIYDRLSIETFGPGCIHFGSNLDEEYYNQLTAERREPKYDRGVLKGYGWRKIRPRNEALDTLKLAYAALESLNINIKKSINRSGEPQKQKTETQNNKPVRRKRNSFVNSWR